MSGFMVVVILANADNTECIVRSASCETKVVMPLNDTTTILVGYGAARVLRIGCKVFT